MMMKWSFPALLAALAIFPSGCTSLSARLPDIHQADLSTEQTFQEKQAFAEMARLRARLSRVSAPVLTANTELCDKTGPDIGAITHTLKSYPKKLRPAAEREFGLGDEPRVLFVRPDSAADKAGIKPGDILRSETGKALSVPGKAASQTVEAGKPILRVRGDEETSLTLGLELHCDYPVKLKMTSTVNAYATGKSIIMTAGMMDFVDLDAELAAIIGHELAHNEMGHIRKIITNLLLSGYATRYTRDFESEADYVGLYYAARAGYAIEGVGQMWRRLGKLTVRPIVRAKTHPAFPDRFVRLAAARNEIKAKQTAGEPLEPNMKASKND